MKFKIINLKDEQNILRNVIKLFLEKIFELKNSNLIK